MGIHVEGQHAYLAWGNKGLAIFDLANPDSPKMIGQCTSLDDVWDVWVKGGYAYVADLRKGVATIDVSDPAKPKKISMVTWDEEEPMAEIIRGEGNALFVAAGNHGLVSLDLSDPAHPRLASIFHPSDGSFGEGLCVRDGLVYLANGHDGLRHENGLIVVDARNLDSLKELGRCCFLGWVEGVCISGAHAFVANTQSGVRSVTVSDPAKPVLKDSFGPIEDPSDPGIIDLKNRIQALEWTGEGDKALQIFNGLKNIKLDDTDFPWLKLGLCLYDGKHYEEALQVFRSDFEQETKTNSPYAFDSLVWQGHLYDLMGQRDKALECYERALGMKPESQVRHDQYGLKVDLDWIKERLKSPFQRD
jgi:hypothetical protein